MLSWFVANCVPEKSPPMAEPVCSFLRIRNSVLVAYIGVASTAK